MIQDKEFLLRNLLSNVRFFHFTDVRNLPSILNHGLLPLDKLQELGIAPYVFDQNRHDRHIFPGGAICVSVGHSARAMARIANQIHYAIIEIDPMIWLAEGERLASPTNAASDDITTAAGSDAFEFIHIPSQLEFLKSRFGIFTLFADPYSVIFKSGQRRTYERGERANRLGMPNDPQAELLLNFEIAPLYFKKIFIRSPEIYDRVTMKYRNNGPIQFEMNEKLFAERFDASRWFERRADFKSAEACVRKVLSL